MEFVIIGLGAIALCVIAIAAGIAAYDYHACRPIQPADYQHYQGGGK